MERPTFDYMTQTPYIRSIGIIRRKNGLPNPMRVAWRGSGKRNAKPPRKMNLTVNNREPAAKDSTERRRGRLYFCWAWGKR